jgi:type II secretory pathway predicted ATPase ExeA
LQNDEGQATDEWEGRAAEAVTAARWRRLDPFGETANPADYVPREVTENALFEMERSVRGRRTTALTAAPGLGKSLLLRLLAGRLGPGFVCLFLPYAAVTLEELCAWSLGLLGEPAEGDPRWRFLRYVRRRGEDGETVVLLIDDAASMPVETARDLGKLVQDSGNRLRLVVAAADDARSSRVIAALHATLQTGTVEVRLTKPMTTLETRRYVHARLDRAGVSRRQRARFNEEAIGRIHRLSGGVPRCVHDLGASLLAAPPDGVGRAWREERWLGAPLEDDAQFL